MSRLTEEIRRLSRKLDNLEQRLEKVEESHIPKFTASEVPQEPKFMKGDWVRSLITGTVGKVEAFYEEGNHSRYLLSTIDGNHFTSRENVIEPYFPKEGEYIYVYFKKTEQRYIVIFSHTNTTYLYDKCSIYLNTDKLEISKIPFCYADLISELRPASAEEKKLLDSKLSEKGLRFDGKEIVEDNTPKVGDFCIFWGKEPNRALCDILTEVVFVGTNSYFSMGIFCYEHCIKFESEEQFRRIKEGKK